MTFFSHLQKIPRPRLSRRSASFALTAWIASVSAIFATSCVVHSDDDDSGSVTLHWTIDGLADPNQCSFTASRSIYIDVFYEDGSSSSSNYGQDCEALGTTINLSPGTYSATVHLEDSSGRPRTTDVQIDPFRIVGGTNLDVPIDFPANSFF